MGTTRMGVFVAGCVHATVVDGCIVYIHTDDTLHTRT